MVTKQERLEAAIEGDMADRPPVALWRHFPVDDQTPHGLAQSTIEFQRKYDFDFVKVTPASSFCLKDWGSMDRWEGNDEGTRTYTHRVIQEPGDWANLVSLSPDDGHLADQLACLHEITETLDDVPVIQTVFSPLAQAKNLAGQGRLMEHLHRARGSVEQGLNVITDSTAAFVQAARETGIAGVFYALQHATYRLFDRASYEDLAGGLDRQILEAADGLWLNVLHLHGEAIHFAVAEDYPADVVNWHARTVGPSLAEAARRVEGAVCGGLQREATLVLGDADSVRQEAFEALDSLEGRGVILGAGCVVPIKAPRANLKAARSAVEDFV